MNDAPGNPGTPANHGTPAVPGSPAAPRTPAISGGRRCWALPGVLAVGVLALGVVPARADLIIVGSPGYDATTGDGLGNGAVPVTPGSAVNNSGVAVGYSQKSDSGSWVGDRAVRWDASGTTATELGHLGLTSSGWTLARAHAVNDAGTAVGWSQKYDSGSDKGPRAVRWDASGTTATELDHLGLSSTGQTNARAYAVNDAGTAVGYSSKYDSGSSKGTRAVRWDASGTTATELEHLGLDNGWTEARAYAVNDAGTAVGWSRKYDDSGSDNGSRAVRWDASGTAATELDHLGLSSDGYTHARAFAVNDAGTAVGYSEKYDSGSYKGYRAVRWDASDTAATELEHLGLSSDGNTYAQAYAVNDAGTAVGYSGKYDSGSDKGTRAVRWDASGTAATELDHLGLRGDGYTHAEAFAVNDAGTAVGWSGKYDSGSYEGGRAVIWLPDASAIDLNDLGVMPAGGGGSWLLRTANALSEDGWVAGSGTFTPEPGGGDAYTRHWVTQVGLGGAWTDDFTGSLDGTWGRGRQWSTGTPAMQVGDAVFNADASYTVSLDRDELTRSITVTAGTVALDFNGFTLEAEDGVSIAADATLSGTGQLIGDVTNAGRLAPGNSPGTLNIDGNLTSTGAITFEIDGTDAGQFDQLLVTGNADLSGTLEIVLGYAAAFGDSFDLLDFTSLTDSGYSFAFTGLDLADGLSWDTTAFATTGTISVIPEPATAALLGLGGLAMLGRRRS